MVKSKTDNDLEERFQWHEGLDPDHIFDEEREMIKELRKNIPQLQHETDKFIATFLFARRHNMKDVGALLKKFYHKKEEFASDLDFHRVPSVTYTKILSKSSEFVGNLPVFQPTGYRDNKGRMLKFMVVESFNPCSRDVAITYALCFWEVYYLVATEPLNAWRNGTVVVLDLKGAGWRNVDPSAKGREAMKAFQGVFPARIRAVWGINGGILISTLMAAAKLVLPKKIMDRIKLMYAEDLKDLIPAQNLPVRFGGEASHDFTFDDYYTQIMETEDRLFSKGIWKVPRVGAPQS